MRTGFNIWAQMVILMLVCTPFVCMAQTPSGWSFSAGMRYRPVDYELRTEPLENWEEFVVPLEGEGSLELYDGVGRIEYQDGWMGPWGFWHMGDGSAYTEGYSYQRRDGSYYKLAYHSTAYGIPREVDLVHSHSFDSGVYGPFLKANLIYGKAFGGRLSLWGDYAFAKEHKRSSQHVGWQRIVQNEMVYRFLYDFDYDDAHWRYAIYDPVLWGHDGTTPGYPRREIASQQDVVIAEFTAIMDSDIDYDLHEFTLGVEWARRFGNRFDLFIAIGPTINIMDWTFSHETSWSATGYADPVAVSTGRESDTDLVIGGMAELGGRLRLTADGRYFCEFSGRYEYLKGFDLTAGTGKANVELEGYTGAIGFGVAL